MSQLSTTTDTNNLRIVVAQLNFTVGAIKQNIEMHKRAAIKARDEMKADVIVFAELSTIGYLAEDLLLRNDFLDAADEALNEFMKEIHGIHCVISHTHRTPDGLQNACSVIYNGELIARYAKMRLPNYGVFDEKRYFVAGTEACVVNIKNIPVGIVICEDLWFKSPVELACAKGAKLILAPNASPFEMDKHTARMRTLKKRALQNNVPIVYANLVGGQDEIIFDGGSLVMSAKGERCQFAGYFNETLLPVNFHLNDGQVSVEESPSPTEPASVEIIYQGLVLALRDYIEKNKFKGVLIGTSGGIDSALTLTIAVDAIGKDRVKAIVMPSRHTSDISMQDANEIIKALQVPHDIISIEPAYEAFINTLSPSFNNTPEDKTEENIQARVRAVILMALSNKFGNLVLTTGNRSELAVGYCTLYGDMAGGFCVLKDIPKTMVYALANYRNKINHVIPTRTIDRPPTAELAPNQTDQDSLPPYDVLDKILYRYLNKSEGLDEIVARNFDRDTVEKVIRLVQGSEYKRRQAAIGPRINHKSFGRDWRYPITDRFKL